LPTTIAGRTISARPPSSIAALVVTLPIATRSGGHTSDASPNPNNPTPPQTMPLRLASRAPSSRAVSFCAAPSSVRARLSSRSTTAIGALSTNAVAGAAPPSGPAAVPGGAGGGSSREPAGTV